MLRLNLASEPRMARPRPRRAGARRALHLGDHGGGPRHAAVEALVATDASEAELGAGARQGDRPASPSSTGRASATPTASRSRSPRRRSAALIDVWPLFEAFQARYVAKGLLLDAGKKRLRALAEWHFGGGDGYCAACPQTCPDCPGRLSRPATVEGWQVWDLALRMSGQLRAVPGAVLGWDLGAGLALAAALGVPALAAAELLPAIEAVAVRSINERMEPRWLSAGCRCGSPPSAATG